MSDQNDQWQNAVSSIATWAAFHVIVCSNAQYPCGPISDFNREDFGRCIFLEHEECDQSSLALDILIAFGRIRNAQVCCKSGCDDCLQTLQSRTTINILAVRIPDASVRQLQGKVLSRTNTETQFMLISLSHGRIGGLIRPGDEYGLVHLQHSCHRNSGIHLATLERTDFDFCEMMHLALRDRENWEATLP